MTSPSSPPGLRGGAALFYLGWAGFAAFGTVVYLDGHADLSYAVIHVVIAGAVCAWHAMTTGRAAPIVGGVLGLLFFLQMALFVVLGNFVDAESLKVRIEDGLGLLAAVLILVGVVRDLRGTATRSRSTLGSALS